MGNRCEPGTARGPSRSVTLAADADSGLGRTGMSALPCPRGLKMRVWLLFNPEAAQAVSGPTSGMCGVRGALQNPTERHRLSRPYSLRLAPKGQKEGLRRASPSAYGRLPGAAPGDVRSPERRHVAGLRRRCALSRQHAGAPAQEHSGPNFRLRKQAARCRIRRDKMSSCEKSTRTVV